MPSDRSEKQMEAIRSKYLIHWEPEGDMPYMVRNIHRDDVPFVTNSWLKSFRESPENKQVKSTFYFADGHKLLEEIIPRSVVLVVCDRQDPHQILGYACYEMFDTALILHYIYIKHTFRSMGIASTLMRYAVGAEAPPALFYTHMTRKFRRMADKKEGWYYRPSMKYIKLTDGFLADTKA